MSIRRLKKINYGKDSQKFFCLTLFEKKLFFKTDKGHFDLISYPLHIKTTFN